MQQITKRSRYHGAMLTLHAGDAAGAVYETKRGSYVQADLECRGGLKLFDYIDPFKLKRQMPAGHPTDDSELAAATAQAFMDAPYFDPEVHYQWLRRFITERRTLLAKGEAYGTGGTLRRALSEPTYMHSLAKFGRGEVRIVPSNGALMRILPVALRYHGRTDEIVKYARWQSCITHMHPLSQAACIAYCVLVHHLLDGHGTQFAWDATRQMLMQKPHVDIPEMSTVLDVDTSIPEQDEIWPNTGSALISFRIALWAALTATDIHNGLTKAISVGGDTDTYAAIAGGILGARFGIEGMPEGWSERLIGREKMLELADGLYDLAHS